MRLHDALWRSSEKHAFAVSARRVLILVTGLASAIATPDNTNTTTMPNAVVIVDLQALTSKLIRMLRSGQLSLRNANNQEPRMHEFDWSPGIGDPTIGGWLTVILYFLTMVSCWRQRTSFV